MSELNNLIENSTFSLTEKEWWAEHLEFMNETQLEEFNLVLNNYQNDY